MAHLTIYTRIRLDTIYAATTPDTHPLALAHIGKSIFVNFFLFSCCWCSLSKSHFPSDFPMDIAHCPPRTALPNRNTSYTRSVASIQCFHKTSIALTLNEPFYRTIKKRRRDVFNVAIPVAFLSQAFVQCLCLYIDPYNSMQSVQF